MSLPESVVEADQSIEPAPSTCVRYHILPKFITPTIPLFFVQFVLIVVLNVWGSEKYVSIAVCVLLLGVTVWILRSFVMWRNTTIACNSDGSFGDQRRRCWLLLITEDELDGVEIAKVSLNRRPRTLIQDFFGYETIVVGDKPPYTGVRNGDEIKRIQAYLIGLTKQSEHAAVDTLHALHELIEIVRQNSNIPMLMKAMEEILSVLKDMREVMSRLTLASATTHHDLLIDDTEGSDRSASFKPLTSMDSDE